MYQAKKLTDMYQRKNLSTMMVARLLGVAVSSVSKWIDAGSLVAGRTPGGHRRIEREDLIRFLRQQKLRIPAGLELSRPKVLIVDDEKPVAKLLGEEVTERFPGCEVLLAFDGYQAGEIIGLSKPEIIILDLHMPGLDGFEICRSVKSNPLLKDPLVIAITGDNSEAVSRRILKMGAAACLGKPVDMDLLSGELSKSLTRGS
jgi:excisionase family DNA binding protein